MAGQTGSHVVVDEFLRGVGLRHVAVAGGAFDFRANMRCVIEFHERLLLKTVDADPGNFPTLRRELRELFDLGFVGGDLRVAEHALSHRRDGGGWTDVGHAVAVDALEAFGDVDFMRIGDGLIGSREGLRECEKSDQ